MRYYHIWVRSDRFRGSEALTYASAEILAVGAIVRVPLRSEQVLGFVGSTTTRPGFAVKEVAEVLGLPPLPDTNVALSQWLQQYYAAPVGVVASQFLPNLPRSIKPLPTQFDDTLKPNTVTWTTEQQRALKTVEPPDTYLLHGRTGSGKTSIYIELARRTVLDGRSAIILSPEIGLTSQLAQEFRKAFGGRVIVLHSGLTPKERLAAWLTILCAVNPVIVIGPRSALFSPVNRLGLIVVDESHDNAYKQEQAPYYHAVRVAAHLREISHATLVLGSATPSVSDYYVATVRKKPIIRLASLAHSNEFVTNDVVLVDLKDRAAFKRSPHLSSQLIDSIASSLGRGEQSLLYLNRRGTARITLCDVCGWQAMCPHCDLPLAYHGDLFRLRCHSCGRTHPPVLACPVCGNSSIILKSFGTKAIVDEAHRLFPDARIGRFDTDSTRDERLEQQYERIIKGELDILVGTQMIAKGLDLPKLSTLGIVLADTSLYLPDFTARERTYQLLTQVLGRVGRGHIKSRAIIQTYYPDSALVQAAIQDDWNNFYEPELVERQQYNFPPFCHLLKLSCRRASSSSSERAAKTLKAQVEGAGLPISIDGPMPAFHEKVGGKYQWQLVVKAHDRKHLLAVINQLPSNWSYDLDPSDLL